LLDVDAIVPLTSSQMLAFNRVFSLVTTSDSLPHASALLTG